MIFFDTETVGLNGPLLTIQHCNKTSEPKLWNIWEEPVDATLDLIESFQTHTVVAWNLVFDWFQLVKWYNIFTLYSVRNGHSPEKYPSVPSITETMLLEREIVHKRMPNTIFLKPKGAIDLMIVAGREKYQYLRRQKPVVIRNVPEFLAEDIIDRLEDRIRLPSGARIRWQVSDRSRRENCVNINIHINERDTYAGLKLKYVHHLMRVAKGECFFDPSTVKKATDVFDFPFEFGKAYAPWGGMWNGEVHRLSQLTNTQYQYALDDATMLRDLYSHFGCPKPDRDSNLCCAVANTRWKGFEIDQAEINRIWPHPDYRVPTAPKAALIWLKEVMTGEEQLALIVDEKETSKADVLEALEKWEADEDDTKAVSASNGEGSRKSDNSGSGERLPGEHNRRSHPVAIRAKAIIRERKNRINRTMLGYLRKANGFHPTLRVAGTLTNRMAGGQSDESPIRRGGSINPQGIDKALRTVFTCATPGEFLGVGDFAGYEVTIAVAVWGSESLEREARAGKKIPGGLFGSVIYDEPYDDIIASQRYDGDYRDKYQHAKNAFYARSYGGALPKLSAMTSIPRGILGPRLAKWDQMHRLDEHVKRIEKEYCIVSNWKWGNPKGFVESLLGVRRYFTMEIAIAKAITGFLAHIPRRWYDRPERLRRKDKSQNPGEAVRSALYSALYSLQGRLRRIATNHEIQAPGGIICKEVQNDVWDELQPNGCHPCEIRMLNSHDEILTVSRLDPEPAIQRSIERLQEFVPLLAMEFKKGLKSWGEK